MEIFSTFLSIIKMAIKYGFLIMICLGSERLVPIVKSFTIETLAWDATKALCILDSASHGCIAFYAWLLSTEFVSTSRNIADACICAMMACCVDVDHFIAAGSWKLEDALRLKSRPPFHCTSMLVLHVMLFSFELISRRFSTKNSRLIEWSFMSFLAIMTHHLRDAYRRGLWFWPVGSTSPLSKPVYIVSITLVPFLTSIIRNHLGMSNSPNITHPV